MKYILDRMNKIVRVEIVDSTGIMPMIRLLDSYWGRFDVAINSVGTKLRVHSFEIIHFDTVIWMDDKEIRI